MMKKWELVELDIKDVKLNPCYEGVTTIADQVKLMETIEESGMIKPIIVNKDNTIIDGMLRYHSKMKLNHKKIKAFRAPKKLNKDLHRELYYRLNVNIAGTDVYSLLKEHFSVEELRSGGYFETEVLLITDEYEPTPAKREYKYELIFQNEGDKEECEQLINQFEERSDHSRSDILLTLLRNL